MKITRRGFVKAAAAAPVAAPAAVKKITEEASRGIAGLRVHGSGGSADVPMAEPTSYRSANAFKWIKQNGLPDWQLDRMWEDAKRDVHSLDADIASMQSFSLAAKVNTQARRNYRKRLDSFSKRADLHDLIDKFKRETGVGAYDFY